MFTGLIREIGTLEWLRRTSEGWLYQVKSSTVHRGLKEGASIAVDGICQSVTTLLPEGFQAIAGEATFKKTTFSSWKRGRLLHLEPALQMQDSLDGHLVQGHVGAKTSLLKMIRRKGTVILSFSIPDFMIGQLDPQDSVALDGVSLTVSRVDGGSFEVNILPDTWSRTHLAHKRRGDLLNFEADFLKPKSPVLSNTKLSNRKLTQWGYV